MKKRLAKWLIVLLGIIGILLLFWYIYFQEKNLKVVFLDVGQGDAIFIETPNKRQILIDGGPDKSVLKEIGDVMPFWDRKIDYVILTHPDADHVVGLLEVLERYEIEVIMDYGVENDGMLTRTWNEKKYKEKASYIQARDQIFSVDDIEIQILHTGGREESVNEKSVVTKIEYKDISLLFTGDIGMETETELLEKYCKEMCKKLQVNVLKVGHHGSSHSSTKQFLNAVSPEVSIIQSGEGNRFGHPHDEVLQRLRDVGSNILRNDQQGTITLFSDGYDIIVYTEG